MGDLVVFTLEGPSHLCYSEAALVPQLYVCVDFYTVHDRASIPNPQLMSMLHPKVARAQVLHLGL